MSNICLLTWLNKHIFCKNRNINPNCKKKIWWEKKGFKDNLELLMQQTSFLDKNETINTRIKYIIKGLKEQKRCYCGNSVKFENTYCSKECIHNSNEVKTKMKETYKKRTGFDHPGQNPEVRKKMERTYFERTGYKCPLENPKVKKQSRTSYKKKTGFEYSGQNPEVRKKMERTYFERTGYFNPSQNPKIVKNRKEIYFDRTGYEYPSQNPEIKQKSIRTCQKKYGSNYLAQAHISKETLEKLNDPEWLKNQNYIQKKTCKGISDELGDVSQSYVWTHFYKYNIKVRILLVPQSKGEKDLLNIVKDLYDGDIISNTRKIISPFELDVYLPDLNIAFEYNGEYWHKEGLMKPFGYHLNKTKLCYSKNIKLYHIWERYWENKQEKMKNVIQNIILKTKNRSLKCLA